MLHAAFEFNSQAGSYNAARRRLIPPFDAFYGTAVTAVGLAQPAPRRVLDLGAGTGVLSAMLRTAFPTAELTLLDAAPQMLEQARADLGTEGTTYIERDLASPLPEGPWDAIVSALAIHHLGDGDKQRLFRNVFRELRSGGVFVNAEQVAGSSEPFTELYASWHERQARAAGSDDVEWSTVLGRMRHDQCATVEDQLTWLQDAGFEHRDCLFKDHRFAVLVAIR